MLTFYHAKQKILISIFALLASIGANAHVVNHVVLPEPTGSVATRLVDVGRYNPTGFSSTPPVGRITSEFHTVMNGRVYMTQQQQCFGDPRPTIPSGDPQKAGVLVTDTTNPRGNLPLIGRIPSDPTTNPKPQWIQTSAGYITSEKMKSRDILFVAIDGSACNPIFSNGGGLNGFELWDISNPDPAKAKLLSFTQVNDANPILAAIDAAANPTPNGARGVAVSRAHLFSQGKKDYLIVLTGGYLGRVKVFDITNPKFPNLIREWGSEEIEFPGVNVAAANDLSNPTLTDLTNFISTFDPYLPFGFDVRGQYLANDVQSLGLVDNKTVTVGMGNYGQAILDIRDLPKIKVVSISRDLNDAIRTQAVGASISVMTPNGKLMIERVASDSTFLKLVFTNELSYPTLVSQPGFTPQIVNLPGGVLTSNELVYVGVACANDASIPAAVGNQTAIILRGACTFNAKINNAAARGYSSFILVNTPVFGQNTIGAAGTSATIPGITIPYYDALRLINPALVSGFSAPLPFTNYVDTYPSLPTNCSTMTSPCGQLAAGGIRVTEGFLKFGNLRIYDTKNVKHPKLLSTVDTYCSLNVTDPVCLQANTSHEPAFPIVLDNQTVAVAWENDGLSIIDLKNPRNPKEIARWRPSGTDFENQNGGAPLASIQPSYDKASGCFFVSDARGGLYILDDTRQGPQCKKVK